MYTTTTRERVCELRMEGKSLNQIHAETGISKSILSEWGIGKITSPHIRERLARRSDVGREKSKIVKRAKRRIREYMIDREVRRQVETVEVGNATAALLCSMLYWGEGAKTGPTLKFTNSDPHLVKVFLSLFRQSFVIDESRLRGILQRHKNTNDEELKIFWSEITGIPLTQFYKSWVKPTYGDKYVGGYKGCIAISYCDTFIMHRMKSYYKAFAEMRASYSGNTFVSKTNNAGPIPAARAKKSL